MAAVVPRSEFALLADLATEGQMTSTALTLDPATTYEQWAALGSMLGRLSHASCWLIGDWLNFGESVFQERYAQAASETGLAPQTLMNYGSVARRVPAERRHEGLPYSSHAVVAAMEPADQERWLARAEGEGWSRSQLEQAVKGENPDRPPSLRDLAAAVWTSSRKNGAGFYEVPEEPMRALGEAL